jgi:hypothetical protein
VTTVATSARAKAASNRAWVALNRYRTAISDPGMPAVMAFAACATTQRASAVSSSHRVTVGVGPFDRVATRGRARRSTAIRLAQPRI